MLYYHNIFAINLSGQVFERFKEPVLKTGVRANVPWVRIPPCPPLLSSLLPISKSSIQILYTIFLAESIFSDFLLLPPKIINSTFILQGNRITKKSLEVFIHKNYK